MEKKFKVTNKSKEVKKFRDRFLGQDVLVEPNKSVLTNTPPKESEIWKVDNIEKLEEKHKSKKEVKMNVKKLENDRSSS